MEKSEIIKLEKEVKEQLKYSIDETEDLTSIIERGVGFLETLTGTTIDFNKSAEGKMLLFAFVRYVVNNAEEYFEENFSHSILRLQYHEAYKKMGDVVEP